MKKVLVIKIGGNIIDDDSALEHFLDDFAKMTEPRILVHGGGRRATDISKRLGIETRMADGRRITDEASLEVVTMVYGGLINKNIVAKLQTRKVNAIGLCGADLNIIPAWKRRNSSIDYGFVGDFDPNQVDHARILWLMESGIVPVFSALTHDTEGSLLNTNADTLASGLAIALSGAVHAELHLCFEKAGVLSDANDDNSLIPVLRKEEYERMKETRQIYEGMIPKLENAFKALESGVEVTIRHALNRKKGTKLQAG